MSAPTQTPGQRIAAEILRLGPEVRVDYFGREYVATISTDGRPVYEVAQRGVIIGSVRIITDEFGLGLAAAVTSTGAAYDEPAREAGDLVNGVHYLARTTPDVKPDPPCPPWCDKDHAAPRRSRMIVHTAVVPWECAPPSMHIHAVRADEGGKPGAPVLMVYPGDGSGSYPDALTLRDSTAWALAHVLGEINDLTSLAAFCDALGEGADLIRESVPPAADTLVAGTPGGRS